MDAKDIEFGTFQGREEDFRNANLARFASPADSTLKTNARLNEDVNSVVEGVQKLIGNMHVHEGVMDEKAAYGSMPTVGNTTTAHSFKTNKTSDGSIHLNLRGITNPLNDNSIRTVIKDQLKSDTSRS